MKIYLDNKEVTRLVPESLPMLIHGAEGSGASMYTIALATKWFAQGNKVIFLCGYPMAEEEFTRLVGEHKTGIFYTKDKVEDFKKAADDSEAIVFVKNIELFDVKVLNSIATKSVIVSGDLDKSDYKDDLLKMPFVTKVYFSQLAGANLPEIKQYEGLVISGESRGVAKLVK